MNKFIELAISKYVNEHPNANESNIISYLRSIGYANEELQGFDLPGSINEVRNVKGQYDS